MSARCAKTVLIVEDQVLVLMAMASYIGSNGYRVLSACRPSRALQLSDEHEGSLDLLLTDVALPEMEGPELARALQARRPELRVLYMSAYFRDTLVRAGRLEADAVLLQKPASRAQVLAEIRRMLGDGPGDEASAR